MEIPTNIRHIHLIAICGTGMGSLALLLKSQGFKVTGSDQNVYPPMNTELEKNGIGIFQGFSAANLSRSPSPQPPPLKGGGVPDLIVVGNAVSKENPEVVAMLDKKIPYLSMPQAISQLFLQNKRSVVVSGTHGKTTTSAIISHLLLEVRADPSFLFGGVTQRGNPGCRLGNGDLFVIEGDEYDTAFFDKGPKFLHYQPFYTIITSLEFDHADIYRDIGHLEGAFEKLVRIVNPAGYLLYCADYSRLHDVIASDQRERSNPVGPTGLLRRSAPRNDRIIESYGVKEGAIWRAANITQSTNETRFDLLHKNKKVFSFRSPLAGSHNVLNATAAIVLLNHLGYSFDKILSALLTFSGVKRRQEVRGIVNDIVVIDDFAHHPTAVREPIRAISSQYLGRRLIAVFEPRTNTSRRKIFQEEYGLKIFPESP